MAMKSHSPPGTDVQAAREPFGTLAETCHHSITNPQRFLFVCTQA